MKCAPGNVTASEQMPVVVASTSLLQEVTKDILITEGDDIYENLKVKVTYFPTKRLLDLSKQVTPVDDLHVLFIFQGEGSQQSLEQTQEQQNLMEKSEFEPNSF